MHAGQTAASLRRDAAIQRIHERRVMPPCSLLTAHRQTVDNHHRQSHRSGGRFATASELRPYGEMTFSAPT